MQDEPTAASLGGAVRPVPGIWTWSRGRHEWSLTEKMPTTTNFSKLKTKFERS